MKVLVTGTPGSGKTTLVAYAQRLDNKRFFDADEIDDLCDGNVNSASMSIV